MDMTYKVKGFEPYNFQMNCFVNYEGANTKTFGDAVSISNNFSFQFRLDSLVIVYNAKVYVFEYKTGIRWSKTHFMLEDLDRTSLVGFCTDNICFLIKDSKPVGVFDIENIESPLIRQAFDGKTCVMQALDYFKSEKIQSDLFVYKTIREKARIS